MARMKRHLLSIIALPLLLAMSPAASAWGVGGHRLVGRLAEGELTPTARRAVQTLLRGEPDPTLAGVSSWADDVRANDPVLGKRSAPWHYVNIHSPACTFDAARDCAGGDCVVGAIRAQAAILADRSQSLQARREALKFVVHFVGDVHQPLHAGHRDDMGGNTVQIRMPTPDGAEVGSNLHVLWDSGLIKLTRLDESAYVARLRALPLAVALPRQALPVEAGPWAAASCAVTMRAGFYPSGPRLAPGYAREWTPIIDQQLRRAGTHLAFVLNAALGR